MARLGGFFVCLLIVAMDIVGGIMGIEAELEQNKVKHLRRWIFECREPSHAAFKLGLAAAGLLVAAHVVANLLGGCIAFVLKKSSKRHLLISNFLWLASSSPGSFLGLDWACW
ncbi:unnamed protein product [Prunus armeniaca]|uniref:Uncharacterized protein n=1 Tax=Prunus armeniaca TaxID=36596 RepID=A0A6J5X1N2_PRUAR|nr:unnamed protein product [Prunus armeniaca]